MSSRHIGTTTATVPVGAQVTVPAPFNLRNGNVMFAFVVSSAVTITAPAGWTKYQTSLTCVFELTQFVKTAGPFEPTSYAFTASGSGPLVAAISAWCGIDPVNPVGTNQHPSTATTTHTEPFTTPTITDTSLSSGRLLFVRASRRLGSPPITFSHTNSGIPGDQQAVELADVGVFSGGTMSYSLGLYSSDLDFTFPSTHNGITITASPDVDTNNVVATVAMSLAPGCTCPNPADSPEDVLIDPRVVA